MSTELCELASPFDALSDLAIPRVVEVMTAAPTCVRPSDSVLELVKMFHARQFRHLLVVDEAERLVGIVSDRDVGRCFGPSSIADEGTLALIPTERIMSTDVVTTTPDGTVPAALDLMQEQGVSSLPVLDAGRLVGIITTSDLLHLLRRMLAQ